MKPDLTPWFDGSVAPVHYGKYEFLRLFPVHKFFWDDPVYDALYSDFAYFNGSWVRECPSCKRCALAVAVVGDSFKWRGLANDPAEIK